MLSLNVRYKVYLHIDLLMEPWFRSDPALKSRLALLLQQFLSNGQSNTFKTVRGPGQGWLRSPMQGFHFYLWWTTGGSVVAKGESWEREEIFLRCLRGHDETSEKLDFGKKGEDYEAFDPVRLREIFALDEGDELLASPYLPTQYAIAHTSADLRILKGLPGTGKTTSLWLSILAAAEEKRAKHILYLTLSDLLIERAQAFFQAMELPTRLSCMTFYEFLSQMTGQPRPALFPLREAKLAEIFESFGKGRYHPLHVWKGAWSSLYAEVYGYALGRFTAPATRETSVGKRLWDFQAKAYETKRKAELQGYEPSIVRIVRFLQEEFEGLSSKKNRGPIAPQPEKTNELLKLFEPLVVSLDALERLERGEALPAGLEDVDWLVIDEVQDMTSGELRVLATYLRRLGEGGQGGQGSQGGQGGQGKATCILTGDEGQTARPTFFTWGELARIFQTDERTVTFDLHENLRSPGPIIALLQASRNLYACLPPEYQPRGLFRIPDSSVFSDSPSLFWLSLREDQIPELFSFFGRLPDSMILHPASQMPKALAGETGEAEANAFREEAAKLLATAGDVKGLDFQRVAVFDTRPPLPAESYLDFLQQRFEIDLLRIAISRPRDQLVILDTLGGQGVLCGLLRTLEAPPRPVSLEELCCDLSAFLMEEAEDELLDAFRMAQKLFEALPEKAFLHIKRAENLLFEAASPSPFLLREIVGMRIVLAYRVAIDFSFRGEAPKERPPKCFEDCFRLPKEVPSPWPALAPSLEAIRFDWSLRRLPFERSPEAFLSALEGLLQKITSPIFPRLLSWFLQTLTEQGHRLSLEEAAPLPLSVRRRILAFYEKACDIFQEREPSALPGLEQDRLRFAIKHTLEVLGRKAWGEAAECLLRQPRIEGEVYGWLFQSGWSPSAVAPLFEVAALSADEQAKLAEGFGASLRDKAHRSSLFRLCKLAWEGWEEAKKKPSFGWALRETEKEWEKAEAAAAEIRERRATNLFLEDALERWLSGMQASQIPVVWKKHPFQDEIDKRKKRLEREMKDKFQFLAVPGQGAALSEKEGKKKKLHDEVCRVGASELSPEAAEGIRILDFEDVRDALRATLRLERAFPQDRSKKLLAFQETLFRSFSNLFFSFQSPPKEGRQEGRKPWEDGQTKEGFRSGIKGRETLSSAAWRGEASSPSVEELPALGEGERAGERAGSGQEGAASGSVEGEKGARGEGGKTEFLWTESMLRVIRALQMLFPDEIAGWAEILREKLANEPPLAFGWASPLAVYPELLEKRLSLLPAGTLPTASRVEPLREEEEGEATKEARDTEEAPALPFAPLLCWLRSFHSFREKPAGGTGSFFAVFLGKMAEFATSAIPAEHREVWLSGLASEVRVSEAFQSLRSFVWEEGLFAVRACEKAQKALEKEDASGGSVEAFGREKAESRTYRRYDVRLREGFGREFEAVREEARAVLEELPFLKGRKKEFSFSQAFERLEATRKKELLAGGLAQKNRLIGALYTLRSLARDFDGVSREAGETRGEAGAGAGAKKTLGGGSGLSLERAKEGLEAYGFLQPLFTLDARFEGALEWVSRPIEEELRQAEATAPEQVEAFFTAWEGRFLPRRLHRWREARRDRKGEALEAALAVEEAEEAGAGVAVVSEPGLEVRPKEAEGEEPEASQKQEAKAAEEGLGGEVAGVAGVARVEDVVRKEALAAAAAEALGYESRGAWVEAAEAWERAEERERAIIAWRKGGKTRKVIEILLGEGQTEQALLLLQSIGAWKEVALLHEREGRPKEEALALEVAQEWREAAECWEALEEWERAAQASMRAKEPEKAAYAWAKAGNPKEAAYLLESLRRWPEAALVWHSAGDFSQAGQAWERAEEWEKAARSWQAARRWPQAAGAWWKAQAPGRAAACLERMEDWKGAAEAWQEAKAWAEAAEAWMQGKQHQKAVWAFLQGGDEEAALSLLRELKDWKRVAHLCQKQGKLEEAAVAWEAAEEWEKAARVWLELQAWGAAAEAFQEAGFYEEAERYFQKAKDSEALLPESGVGEVPGVAEGLSEGEESEEVGEASWREKAKRFEGEGEYEEAASCLEMEGEWEEAARLWERACEEDVRKEGPPKSWQRAARAWEEAGKRELAEAARLQGMVWKEGAMLSAYAERWEGSGEGKKAAVGWTTLRRWERAAKAWEGLGRFERASAAWGFAASEENDPKKASGLWEKAAWSAERGGDVEGACRSFRKAGERGKEAEAWERAGEDARAAVVWEESGEWEKAAPCWERLKEWEKAGEGWEKAAEKRAKGWSWFGGKKVGFLYAKAAAAWEEAKEGSRAKECREKAGEGRQGGR